MPSHPTKFAVRHVRTIFPAAFLLAAFLLAALASCAGQTAANPPGALQLVVILSRHGVRSPTWTQERLDSYSVLPWPRWSVPPADLTAQGYDLLKLFGGYDRGALATAGLLTSQGCADSAATYIWADTDQRTLASAKALGEGLFPGCVPAVHSLAEGANDPLFHPATAGPGEPETGAALTQLEAELQRPPSPAGTRETLVAKVQHLLFYCSAQDACTPAKAPAMPLSTGPTLAVRGKGDHIVDLQGPLPVASSLAEDFLLEYADGMKASDVGWGHVDEPTLRRLLALHTDYFSLMHRTPALARVEASNLLAHIAGTLAQHVTGRTDPNAMGPQSARLVLLVGHDTNLAGVAELLGLHWTLDGRTDDTVPGTELAFELWQDVHGTYSVRIRVAAQTLPQLRDRQPLTASTPPATEIVTPSKCAKQGYCAWVDFSRIASSAIDRAHVIAEP